MLLIRLPIILDRRKFGEEPIRAEDDDEQIRGIREQVQST